MGQSNSKKALAKAAAASIIASDFKVYDSHTHLQDESFSQAAAEAAIGRALKAQVSPLLMPTWDDQSLKQLCDFHANLSPLAKTKVRYAIGYHPHAASEYISNNGKKSLIALLEKVGQRPNFANQDNLEHLLATDSLPKIVAIGEIGLDYYYDNSPRELQKQAFYEQLELAYQYNLPVSIHCREAYADCLDILKKIQQAKKLLAKPGSIHCYSGSVETAKEFLKLGFSLGFDGPITYKNARRALEVIEAIPLTKILVETDAPYLTPEPYRGQLNEPIYSKLVVAKIAEIKALAITDVAKQIYLNTIELFGE